MSSRRDRISPADPTKGKVKFIDSHRPVIDSGDYQLTVTQTLEPDKSRNRHRITTSKTQNFSVRGPRVSLDDSEVFAMFPPPGSLGEHSNVLPHISFWRSTLPWERSGDNNDKAKPWLALLLFHGAELEDSAIYEESRMTLADFKTEVGNSGFGRLAPESGDHDDEMVSVIKVMLEPNGRPIPSLSQLDLLRHVRQPEDDAGKPDGNQVAVVVCNRLPAPGSLNVAHLVSIESRFTGQGPKARATGERITLVSLKSWRFSCASKAQGFKQLLNSLESSALKLPPTRNQTANAALDRGLVPLPHTTRQGNAVVSWYRGPLLPGAMKPVKALRAPGLAADQFAGFDPASGLQDTSYSAAWELGRMLMLSDKNVSVRLFNWKRQHAGYRKDMMPGHLGSVSEPPEQNLPGPVEAWFKDLLMLKGIPFSYLVPDEKLLPPESIRFFQVDVNWMRCVADGAFNVGHVRHSDRELAGALDRLNIDSAKSGVLIRSELASGWPDMLVEATGKRANGVVNKLSTLRIERLSKNVLLCLFGGILSKLEIHQKPEALHFGVSLLDKKHRKRGRMWKGVGYYKQVRDQTGREVAGKIAPVRFLETAGSGARYSRIVDLDDLKRQLQIGSSSSQLAMQLIEGVEKVTFLKS